MAAVGRRADPKIAGMDREQVGFALRHLYGYPRLRLAYTYIPKNACTALKRTLGHAQGWLTAESRSAHEMRRTWWLSGLASYPLARDRVVVVRDPFDRVLSAYYSKFVLARDGIAEQAMATGLAAALRPGATRDDVTFADFVGYLSRTPDRVLDDHWRPQHDFLIGSYNQVVRFDRLDEDSGFLRQRGLALDPAGARATSTIATDLGTGWSDRPAARLRVLRRRRGLLPSGESMYDDRLRAVIGERFGDDVDLVARATAGRPLRAARHGGG